MKRHGFISMGMAVAGFTLAVVPVRADVGINYSSDQLDIMDDWGFFPPEFKARVEDLFDTNKAIIKAQNDEAELKLELPDYLKKADVAEAKEDEIRQELADYDHTDETDFAQLQKDLNDPKAKLEDLIKEAQEFVWAYSTSPHLAEAQQYLQQAQLKEANESQEEKDAEAARVAARAKLLQRVQARDLSLQEWRDFLYNMSEEDVVRYIGQPDAEEDDYWLYSGDFTQDPKTLNKVGLRLNFNAGRIVTILALPHAQ